MSYSNTSFLSVGKKASGARPFAPWLTSWARKMGRVGGARWKEDVRGAISFAAALSFWGGLANAAKTILGYVCIVAFFIGRVYDEEAKMEGDSKSV